ncbi:MAG TPA: protein kinase [Bryobacteraceae bacterium]|nr:protein kinase [Bryobacteraceae bacterium]
MPPAEWERVKSIFAASLHLAPDQRAEFLDDRCAGFPEIRAEVESLLASHEGAGDFLFEPALVLPSEASSSETVAMPGSIPPRDRHALCAGDRLGVYTIVQKIDEGGMAVVYQAVRDDPEFRKLVAIKVLKPGMDTHFVLERFQNEKQILAHFDHANIAKVLDSGSTPAGRPYFVLEFIAGEPIDVFCRERCLPVDGRLKLFQRVCAAVEYAHQNLIVHRDLKPRNILVTGDGDPKLLDFGIAKILSDDRELTMAGIRPMTPEYASPEQVRGEPVSTATDIYGLGVILYELLTGSRPFRAPTGSAQELARMIVETVPKRPSTLLRNQEELANPPCAPGDLNRWARRLRGDLDNIILKAMHPEPKRRYRSVGELSVDIDRYFAGEPVVAAGDDWKYVARKFVLRHRTGVMAGAAAFASLATGLFIAQHEATVARNQRTMAEQRAAQIRSLANSLLYDLHDAIQNLPGATPVRAKLMDRAAEALDSLKNSPNNDPVVLRELATAYERLADVQGSPQEFNLGDLNAALRNYRNALVLLDKVRAASPDDLSVLRSMAEIEWPMSSILERQGDAKGAAESAQKALDLRVMVAGAEPQQLEARRDLAKAYYLRGHTAVVAGDLQTARSSREKSLQLWESIAKDDPGDSKVQFEIALAAKNLSAVEQRFQDFNAAQKHLTRARAIDQQRCLAAPQDATAKLDLSFDLSELAELAIRTGRIPDAADLYRQAREIREDLLAHDTGNHRLVDRVSYILSREGRVQLRLRHLPEASRAFQRALSLRRKMAADPSNFQAQFFVAESQADLGALTCATGNATAGQTMLQGALAKIAELSRKRPLSVEDQETVTEFGEKLTACASPQSASDTP